MTHAHLVVTLALAAFGAAANAQRPGQAERLPTGAPPAAQACIGCHGARGEGNPEAGAPRIAGQAQRYLRKQLDSYADGTRRSVVMQPIARGLPPQLRTEVAAYYAGLDAPGGRVGATPPARGEHIAERGDNDLGVQACRNCHGPGGVGEPPNIPYLAGLDANYLKAELRAWKEGTRTNDAGQQMFSVASALPDADIEAVARYYASLSPPAPAPSNLIQAPRGKIAPAGPAATAEPAGPSAEKRGGVEQGAPTTGGTQGPGGEGASTTDDETKSQRKRDTENKPNATESDANRSEAPTWPRVNIMAESESAASPETGRALVASGAYGCQACHTIPGIRWPQGVVGPPLAGFALRPFIAGQLRNDRDTLAAFLHNPPALIPQTGMPNLGLALGQARQIAAFLHTLDDPDAR